MSDVRNLVERLRQIAESQRMDLDSPNVAATLDDAATTLEALASIGSVVAEEPEGDDEPCKAEIWSWDIFRHQEVDPYWMRCHRIGAHDKHENSETGATWPVKQEGAE